MATSGDFLLAITGDFFMAMDSRHHSCSRSLHARNSVARSATRYQISFDDRPLLLASDQT